MTIMNDEKTKQKVKKLLAERDEALRPVWVRTPRPGEVEFYSSLGRGKLYQAEAAGHIRTASLKPPGAVRGVILFNLKSILEYVEKCTTPSPVSPPRQEAAADKYELTDNRDAWKSLNERLAAEGLAPKDAPLAVLPPPVASAKIK
jgi:hypothetical protein